VKEVEGKVGKDPRLVATFVQSIRPSSSFRSLPLSLPPLLPQVHGKETASYIKTQSSAAAGAAVASTRETKEEVVREWIKSTGLGSLIYKSIMPAHWKLPVISLGVRSEGGRE